MPSKKKSIFSGIFSKNSYIPASIVTVAAVGLLIWAGLTLLRSQPKEATLVIASREDGKQRMFTGEVIDGMTVLDALIASSEAGQIEFRYSLDKNGKLVIQKLNGYDSKVSSRELLFYLNGAGVGIGEIDKTIINSGDRIEIHLN